MAKIVEDQLQALLFQWHWNGYPKDRRMLFHVKQNTHGDAIRGSLNKAIGVVRGISDMIHIGKQVLFIELKVENNRQTPEQIEFMNRVRGRGHRYELIRDYETGKRVIIGNMLIL